MNEIQKKIIWLTTVHSVMLTDNRFVEVNPFRWMILIFDTLWFLFDHDQFYNAKICECQPLLHDFTV